MIIPTNCIGAQIESCKYYLSRGCSEATKSELVAYGLLLDSGINQIKLNSFFLQGL